MGFAFVACVCFVACPANYCHASANYLFNWLVCSHCNRSALSLECVAVQVRRIRIGLMLASILVELARACVFVVVVAFG